MARFQHLLGVLIVQILISISLQCGYEPCPNPFDPDRPSIHTMCLYSDQTFGAECQNHLTTDLTDKEKKELLELHNHWRLNVASGEEHRGLNNIGQPGGLIKPLEWDDELAIIAQRWANQCLREHDKCRNINGISIGQNVGWNSFLTGATDKFTNIVTSWYDEVKEFDHNLVDNFNAQPHAIITHYTQLIWANTTHVGCGGITYETDRMNLAHLVCNYSPVGNTVGDAVYNSHDASAQPEETQPSVKKSLDKSEDSRPNFIATRFADNDADASIKRFRNSDAEIPVHDAAVQSNQLPLTKPYPTVASAGKCHKIFRSSLNQSEIQTILNLHNHIRLTVSRGCETRGLRGGQPAGYIRALHWNESLAKNAQQWANQCEYQRQINRTINGIEFGQNVGQLSNNDGGTIEMSAVVNSWNSLVNTYNSDQVSRFESDDKTMVDFYTQLVWAETTDVGCGGVKYLDSQGYYKTFLVCNYYPAGNIEGEPVYKIRNNLLPSDCAKPAKNDKQNERPDIKSKPDVKCKNVNTLGLTENDKTMILRTHQQFIQPGNINSLNWNNELEQSAQNWANQCRVNDKSLLDSPDSRIRHKFGLVGDKSQYKYKFSDIIKTWNSGVIDWSKFTDIGCGGIKYKDVQGYHNTYLICQYGSFKNNNSREIATAHQFFGGNL